MNVKLRFHRCRQGQTNQHCLLTPLRVNTVAFLVFLA
jgi:hypothetical protein